MTHTNAHKSGYKGQHINSLKYTYKARTVPGAGTTAENETDHTRSSRRVWHALGLRVAPTDAFGGLALWRARDVCTVHTVPQFIAQVVGPGLEPPVPRACAFGAHAHRLRAADYISQKPQRRRSLRP